MKYGLMLALPLTLGIACGNELGDCDMPAAQQLVYGPGNRVATKGQALVHESCGQGGFCHSSAAHRAQRKGAPHGMDFDMLPVPTGLKDILDHAEASWEQIEKGAMPPEGFAVGNSAWTYSRARRPDEARLPTIRTGEGKTIVRNWLACGGPVVTDSKVPEWAQLPGTLEPIWSELHSKVVVERCALSSCHDASRDDSGDLDLKDPCRAREALLKGKSKTCNEARVVPGDPAASFLLHKLGSDPIRCGGRMPTGGALAIFEIEAFRLWIEAGAKADECK